MSFLQDIRHVLHIDASHAAPAPLSEPSTVAAPASAAAIPPSPTHYVEPKGALRMSWFTALFTIALAGFKGFFAKLIPTLKDEAKAELAVVETAIVTFAKSDLGKLAVDCVNLARSKGETGDAAFAIAKAQFIADAKTAGHDLSAIGSGVVDWMIQTAYTVIASVVSQAPASK